MVFLSLNLFARARGPDEFWRKRKIFKLAAHFYGRRRNCYSMAIRGVHKALWQSTIGRRIKKQDMKELWETRATAATEEHGLTFNLLRVGLNRCSILLNRKTLADLAIWEPRTFKSLTDVAAARVKVDGHRNATNVSIPEHVMPGRLIE